MYIEVMIERVMNITKCLDMYENCSWYSDFPFSRIVLGAMEFWKHFFEEINKAEMELEAKDIKEMLHSSSVNAVHMLVTEPVVFTFGLWMGSQVFTFLFLSVISITFQ